MTRAVVLPRPLSGATLFLGAYPDSVLVFDEAKGQIVDRIPLVTGLPTSMRLSLDRKKIYVTTNDHSGIEVIDVATRKVTNHFVLNTRDQAVPLQWRRARSRRQGPLHASPRRSTSWPTVTRSASRSTR